MIQHITAIYENGVLKPLQPLNLANEEVVTIAVQRASDANAVDDDRLDEGEEDDEDYIPWIAAEGDPSITFEEIHARLAKLPGSLSEDIIRDRDERF
jgi:predicted DNA-binding antitoxin AbrB/MazE fold protein